MVEESGPALKEAPVIDNLKVNSDKGARSSEWVKVTDRPGEASFGEALTARAGQQSRSAGPRDVKQKRGVKSIHIGECSFFSGADVQVCKVLLRTNCFWGKFKFAN